MQTAAAVFGIILILIVLWDGFETIVLPRRVIRRLRLTRLFYRYSWIQWSWLSRKLFSGRELENILGFYGPLSLLFLIAIWAGGLVLGFGLLYFGTAHGPGPVSQFLTALYFSGTTFFTLGLGDVPATHLARFLVVLEAGMGFGFLALIIAYLPLINQSFSQREIIISLLDARAGSPPTAVRVLQFYSRNGRRADLTASLYQWERWCAELLESHLSYPVLAYYRSQHDYQSWIGALTTILDVSALILAGVDGDSLQAKLTFAMGRHTVVDLADVFDQPPRVPEKDRLPLDEFMHSLSLLRAAGMEVTTGKSAYDKLKDLRDLYEPYINSLANFFCLNIPPWIPDPNHPADWETSPWEPVTPGKRKHF